MKKLRFQILLSILCLSSLGWLSALWAQVEQERGKTLRIGVYENPPLIATENNGRMVGITAAPLKVLLDRFDVKPVFVQGSFSELLEKLKAGSIDIMPAVAYSPVRASRMMFNKVKVIDNWAIVFSRPGLPINSILDLSGKSVGVLENDIHAAAFDELCEKLNIKYEKKPVDSYDESLNLLESEQIDAAILPSVYSQYSVYKTSAISTQIIFNQIKIHYAFAPREELLVYIDELDQILEKQKNDPKSPFNQAKDEWLNRLAPSVWHKVLAVVVSILLVCFLVTLVFNRILKRMVAARTREVRKESEKARIAALTQAKFLASINDELKTPLGVIVANADLQLQLFPDNQELMDTAAEIKKAAQNLGAEYSRVLLASKLSGDYQLQIKKVDLGGLLEKIITAAKEASKGRDLGRLIFSDLNYQSDIPKGLEAVGDEHLLHILITEVIRNALLHSLPTSQIKVALGKREDAVHVVVANQTEEPFNLDDFKDGSVFFVEQLDKPIVKAKKSMGLGMFLIKRIADLCNIKLESCMEGNDFKITIIIPDLAGSDHGNRKS